MSFPSWSLSTRSFQASPQMSLMQSNLRGSAWTQISQLWDFGTLDLFRRLDAAFCESPCSKRWTFTDETWMKHVPARAPGRAPGPVLIPDPWHLTSLDSDDWINSKCSLTSCQLGQSWTFSQFLWTPNESQLSIKAAESPQNWKSQQRVKMSQNDLFPSKMNWVDPCLVG